MNSICLMGRLTGDPELKTTQNGISVVSFRVAVDRAYRAKDQERQADFIPCTAWRQTAEFISKYFKKGSALCVTGSIQTRSWQDQQGQRRYATEVVVDEAMFVDSRNEGAAAPGGYTPDAYAAPSFSTPAGTAPNFEELKADDDLPF